MAPVEIMPAENAVSPRKVSALLAGIIAVCLLRAVAAAVLPLSADEAYYWLWSRHLSSGYLDHPPAIAFLIRGGTALLGATEAGVRITCFAASLISTWLVWRTARLLLGTREDGARAALFFNLTLMIGAEMLAATPDAPAVLCSTAVLYALARLESGNDGRWWLLAGAAGGLALLSKYTALFLGAGVVLWLVATDEGRRWLKSAWPYASGIVAILVFSPNLVWNGEHHWQTFVFQFSRVGMGALAFRFLPEFVAAQIGLATPFVLVLAAIGLRPLWYDARHRFVVFLFLPAIAYFLVHALHDRVQANWTSFLFPALSILAAAGYRVVPRSTLSRASQRLAVPVAALMLVVAYAQALFGIVAWGRSDPLSRLLGFGIVDVAQRVESLRTETHAAALITTDYATAAWLSFYQPNHVPVLAFDDEMRWSFADAVPTPLVTQPLLYVVEDRHDAHIPLSRTFGQVALIANLGRDRGRVPIGRYVVYRVSELRGGNSALRAP